MIQEHQFLKIAGHTNRPRPVAEVPLQLSDDRERRERRERHAALRLESIDRVQQADVRDLDEVLERFPAPHEPSREILGERLEPFDESIARVRLALEPLEQRLDVVIVARRSCF